MDLEDVKLWHEDHHKQTRCETDLCPFGFALAEVERLREALEKARDYIKALKEGG